MHQTLIFAPVFTMMLLTMAVWIVLFIRRIPFIENNNLSPEQLTPVEFTRISPATVSNPSDNFKNIFEIPVLFYVMAMYLFVTQQVDMTYLIASWIFVVFRGLHSAVHCSANNVKLRFTLYLISTVALWFIAVRASMYYLGL